MEVIASRDRSPTGNTVAGDGVGVTGEPGARRKLSRQIGRVLSCAAGNFEHGAGRWQVLGQDRPNGLPVAIGGWSVLALVDELRHGRFREVRVNGSEAWSLAGKN